MLDAILPIVVLIVLIALTIASFGVGATDGPLQVALMLSAAFASLVALKNGYTSAALAEAAIGGVSTAVGAIFILLSVGALIGTWNMAGTIPTVVDYGVRLLNPSVFFLATAAICAIVGMVTGSSWTTAGTLGVAFVGMANVMGVSEAIAAGAVICGAYFGDKMTPLSETTILVPRLVGGGLTTPSTSGTCSGPRGPPSAISLVLFLIIGLGVDSQRRGQHRRGARRSGKRLSHLAGQPAPARAAGRLHASRRRRRSWRSWDPRCSPASLRASPSGPRSRRSSTTPTRGRSRPPSTPCTARWPPGS